MCTVADTVEHWFAEQSNVGRPPASASAGSASLMIVRSVVRQSGMVMERLDGTESASTLA